MNNRNLSNRILVSITGSKNIHWLKQLKELEKYKITEVALFLELFKNAQRKKIYKALLDSNIKSIPLVHIRNDMYKEELEFLVKNFKSKYFTIHEDSFKVIKKWKGYYKKLYLEMNTDSFIAKNVDVKQIGGFCIDLSHFKVEEQKWTKEYEYIIELRKKKKLFACNHLNGYSYKENRDLHTVKKLKEFEYLKTLPYFVFGKIIAIETFNSIKDQLKFKKHVIKMFK